MSRPDDLARLLEADGVLPAEWGPAFRAVAREHFVPDLVWPDTADDPEAVVERGEDPRAWLDAVYDDRALVTQWDDGQHRGRAPGRQASSSVSAPSVVAEMLYDLDIHGGERVLEIGTGSGWNAALLAARGCEVTTIEVDPDVADRARVNLARAGVEGVRVVTGDGILGHPQAAPYARVVVTAGVRRIPAGWPAQTAPGGFVVMPWGTDYGTGDCALRLAVTDRAGASGPFTMALTFMKLRAQRPDWARYGGSPLPADWAATARSSGTDLDPADVCGSAHDPVTFVLGLLVPNCLARLVHDEGAAPDGGGTLWLYGADTGAGRSVAAAGFAPGHTPSVLQSGPRSLWTEVEAAYRWWHDAGRPTIHDFGLNVTVRPDGRVDQRPWYKSADNELRRPA